MYSKKIAKKYESVVAEPRCSFLLHSQLLGGGLPLQEKQDLGISHPAPSYLLLRLSWVSVINK